LPTPAPSTFACDIPGVQVHGINHIVRGDSVQARFDGFAPNSAVTLALGDWEPDVADRVIGDGIADANGTGLVEGVIPADSPIGEDVLRVISGDCSAFDWLVVIGSPEAMSVDDETVAPGQLVTVTAGGFVPHTSVFLTIDTYPTQGECWPHPCRQIGGFGRTSSVGSVVIRVRIPADVTPGVHGLFTNGYTPDSNIYDLTVGTRIRVVGASGTLPPTDTEPID
jgi:hypothetical protein